MNLEFFAGLFLLCVFVATDTFVRLRLKSAGLKWAFLRGGTLNYGEYKKYGRQRGWPMWPVYLLWASLIVGLALFIAGVIPHPHSF